MYDIIKYPIFTEEACRLIEDNNCYMFYVDRRANKPMLRAAFETVFKIKVSKVNTVIHKREYEMRQDKIVGKKQWYKIAYVMVEKGYSIDLFPDDPEAL